MKQIKILQVKKFMEALLLQEAFDLFDLQSAKVTTYNTFTIDGRVHAEFYGEEKEEHPEVFSSWKQMRGLVKDLIRGKHTPLSFLLILRLQEEAGQEVLSLAEEERERMKNMYGFVLSIKYQDGNITLTTGVEYKIFAMDKEAEGRWDAAVPPLLGRADVSFEEL